MHRNPCPNTSAQQRKRNPRNPDRNAERCYAEGVCVYLVQCLSVSHNKVSLVCSLAYPYLRRVAYFKFREMSQLSRRDIQKPIFGFSIIMEESRTRILYWSRTRSNVRRVRHDHIVSSRKYTKTPRREGLRVTCAWFHLQARHGLVGTVFDC